MVNAPLMAWSKSDLSQRLIEEMPASAILHLDDPDIGIEAKLAREISLYVRFRRGLHRQSAGEGALSRMGVVKCGLWRRCINLGGAIKAVELDEDRAGL